MTEPNANTSELPNDNVTTPAPSQKRDREYGMHTDGLVEDRGESRMLDCLKRIIALSEECRLDKIYKLIFKHRRGTPVRVLTTARGSYNVVFGVEYTDGSAALRLALPGTHAFAEEKVRVEVATLRYIERMTSIPVPHVYHRGTTAECPWQLGPFIIMDYIPHKCDLSDVLREKSDSVEESERKYYDRNVPRDKLERLYRQVARIMLQLSRLEMPLIGSLAYDKNRDAFTIGSRPLTQDMNALVMQGGVPPCVLPPESATYSSAQEWYEVLADLHIAHLAFQRNDAIESADDCRDKFVARYLFRKLVCQRKLFPDSPAARRTERRGREKESFRLWIDDFRPHNILVDENLNVVGVIDWEWAYFAPTSFRKEPPWWLLLSRPEYWRGTVLVWREEFSSMLDVFCQAVHHVEEKEEEDMEEEDGEWSLDQHIAALSLDSKVSSTTPSLSEQMRLSWDSGTFWANYAVRGFYALDPVYWEFLDERFFGKNAEGGFEGRMHLLPDKVQKRMQLFVDKKVEDSKEKRIVEWEPEQAKQYLAEILADLD